MGTQTVTAFFMWCTIINGIMFFLANMMCILAPGWIHRMQGKWFPMPRETFDVVLYSFLGLFKIVFIVFNLVPFVAMLIVG